MIKTDIISGNALSIVALEKLKADDFRQIAEVDPLRGTTGTGFLV
jgi:hypothetical protein